MVDTIYICIYIYVYITEKNPRKTLIKPSFGYYKSI